MIVTIVTGIKSDQGWTAQIFWHQPGTILIVSSTNTNMLALGKYSFGMGDRFAHQARAQLRACLQAAEHGVEVIPVWNKSNREHLTIGSEPESVRAAVEVAVRELKWTMPHHAAADH